MPYSEEKLLILKMLEEGKITSDEAAKLLEALGKNSSNKTSEESSNRQKQNNFQDEVNKVKSRIHEWKEDFKSNVKQKDFDRTVEEFVTKAEKLGKNVAVTTFGLVDKMVDFVGSFVDTNSFNVFGSYNVEDRSFDIDAIEGMGLNVEGVNGHIVVKKHDQNKIIIKTKVRSPQNNADEILLLNQQENQVTLKLNKTFNISVAHEIYLPALKFKNIKLVTTNGRIYVEDSQSEVFEGTTRNAHVELMGVNSDKISVNTKNARIQISYITGKEIDINTSNSLIDVKHIKTENVTAVTTNGRISAENIQNHESANTINLNFKTSNGWIKVNMNDDDNRGYKVKAQTTNGGVNLLIPQIVYNNISKQGMSGSSVEAESIGYEDFPAKANITAESVNGYIEIVK